MVIWAAVMGAVIGWFWAGIDQLGLLAGGVLGALAGVGLRAAVRAEVAQAVERLRVDLSSAASPAIVVEPIAQVEPPFGERFAGEPVHRPATSAPPEPVAAEPEYEGFDRFFDRPRSNEPGVVAVALASARAWLFGGNTVVRLGLVILFVGLSFLIRYAAAAGLFPIELRLAAVALAGAVLLGVGFRTREVRSAFGLALQGAGVAVIYLTLFAAVRLVSGFPVLAAFALMILVCAFGCALALLQRSQALAVTAFAGGFATPLLLSDGSGDIAGLFGYYTILNLAILFIAGRRSWRVLNLLGFFVTFGVAGLVIAEGYTPTDFVATQAFVAASVLIYLAAAVLFARATPGRLGSVVDSTLLFGPALAGFGLEVALVGDRPFGAAFAAVAFAALYLIVSLLAARRNEGRYRVLHEAMLAIGVGFATLAVPLALGARWTSAAWALEGAGALWVGVRQQRWLPRLFGLALQAVAALLFLASVGANVSAVPLANAAFVGAMLIAASLIASAWWVRHPITGAESRLGRAYGAAEVVLARPVFLAGFFFWWLAWAMEAGRVLPPAVAGRASVPVFVPGVATLLAMLAFVLSAGGWRTVGRRRDWAVATWPSFATLFALVLGFLLSVAEGRSVLFLPDAAIWTGAIGVHLRLLFLNDRDAGERARMLLAATHVGGVWLASAMLADSLWLGVDRMGLWNTSWAGVVFLVSVVAVLIALTLWAARALGRSEPAWPLDRHASAYGWVAALPIAALVFGGALVTGLLASGEARPLPYLPLLNPVDLSLGLALVALVLWRRAVLAAEPLPVGAHGLAGTAAPAAIGALAFVALNTAWLRLAHQWFGVEWGPGALLGDNLVQTGLSILWTLIALSLMLWANRMGRRLPWLVGAGLLALTVAKLLLVDLSSSGGGGRIIAFIGVGALMLVLGYFAPLPPREKEAS